MTASLFSIGLNLNRSSFPTPPRLVATPGRRAFFLSPSIVARAALARGRQRSQGIGGIDTAWRPCPRGRGSPSTRRRLGDARVCRVALEAASSASSETVCEAQVARRPPVNGQHRIRYVSILAGRRLWSPPWKRRWPSTRSRPAPAPHGCARLTGM